jgi:hypothetical protein
VYLSIERPVWLGPQAIECAGRLDQMRRYRDQGYDGAIFAACPSDLTASGPQGQAPQIVAFDPRQVKSATANIGTYDPADPRFDR